MSRLQVVSLRQRRFSTPSDVVGAVTSAAAASTSWHVQAYGTDPSLWQSIIMQGASLFETMHVTTGLPYWAAIVATTFAFRACLTPFTVMAMKNGVNMADAKPEMEILSANLRRAGKDPTARIKYYEELKKLQKKYDFSMGRSFLPMVIQAPFFIVMFTATRHMLDWDPAMMEAGTLWFKDLTATDEYFRLNFLTAGVMYASMKLGVDRVNPDATQAMMMKAISYVLPLGYLVFTMSFSQGMHLFWLSGSLAAIAANLIIRKTPVGAMLGVKKPKSQIVPVAVPPTAVFATRQAAKSAKQMAKEHAAKHGKN